MTDKTSLELHNDAWRVIHAMMLEHPVPRHTAFSAIQAFEQAMLKAQQPEPTIEGNGK